jgi:hypothetical protein
MPTSPIRYGRLKSPVPIPPAKRVKIVPLKDPGSIGPKARWQKGFYYVSGSARPVSRVSFSSTVTRDYSSITDSLLFLPILN